ncbi:MAG: flavodoxin family protein [bacterium]
MKILVAYVSWTGNTRKIAEAIFQELPGKKELKQFNEIQSLEDCDFTFVGFPIHGFGHPADEAGDFLERYCKGKKTAIFITHSAPVDSPYIPDWLENCREAAKGVQLIGICDFQGQISLAQVDATLQSPDPMAFELARNVVHSSLGKPDEEQFERARAFAREIVQKVGA